MHMCVCVCVCVCVVSFRSDLRSGCHTEAVACCVSASNFSLLLFLRDCGWPPQQSITEWVHGSEYTNGELNRI